MSLWNFVHTLLDDKITLMNSHFAKFKLHKIVNSSKKWRALTFVPWSQRENSGNPLKTLAMKLPIFLRWKFFWYNYLHFVKIAHHFFARF